MRFIFYYYLDYAFFCVDNYNGNRLVFATNNLIVCSSENMMSKYLDLKPFCLFFLHNI